MLKHEQRTVRDMRVVRRDRGCGRGRVALHFAVLFTWSEEPRTGSFLGGLSPVRGQQAGRRGG